MSQASQLLAVFDLNNRRLPDRGRCLFPSVFHSHFYRIYHLCNLTLYNKEGLHSHENKVFIKFHHNGTPLVYIHSYNGNSNKPI